MRVSSEAYDGPCEGLRRGGFSCSAPEHHRCATKSDASEVRGIPRSSRISQMSLDSRASCLATDLEVLETPISSWNWYNAVSTSFEPMRRSVLLAFAKALLPSGVESVPTIPLMATTNSDRKGTRLHSSHLLTSYAVFC